MEDRLSPHVLYPLNDGVGSVALIHHVGDDKSIVRAARVAFGETSREDFNVLRAYFLMGPALLTGEPRWMAHSTEQQVLLAGLEHWSPTTLTALLSRYLDVVQQAYSRKLLRDRGQAKALAMLKRRTPVDTPPSILDRSIRFCIFTSAP